MVEGSAGPDKGEVLAHACAYLGMGLSMIPVQPMSKVPAFLKLPVVEDGEGARTNRWDEYRQRKPTYEEIGRWFGDGDANIGIVCGAVSGGLVVIDFDDMEAALYCFPRLHEMGKDTILVATGRGAHIYVRIPSREIRSEDLRRESEGFNIEIKGEGSYVVAPPSIHENGKVYQVVGDAYKILEITGEEWDKFRESLSRRAEEWPISRVMVGHWKKGARQNMAMGLAGLARKRLNWSEGRAWALVGGICSVAHDEEPSARLKAVKNTYSLPDIDEVAVGAWMSPEIYDELNKVLSKLKRTETASNHHFEYEFPLSDSEYAGWKKDGIWVFKKGPMGVSSWRRVIAGRIMPMAKLLVDGEIFYEYELDRKEILTAKVDILLKRLKERGLVLTQARAADVLAVVSMSMAHSEKVVHATFGVYADDDGVLGLCTKPMPTKDEQSKAWNAIAPNIDRGATAAEISAYIDMLAFWHPYEVLPAIGLGLIAPFTPVLRSRNIVVPYLYHWSPESDLGKSLVAMMASTGMFGLETISGGSIDSNFRLASHLDSICLPVVVEEADKLRSSLYPTLKDSAERWLADQRGTTELQMIDYHSRSVLMCTGNSISIRGRSILKRFLVVRFDSGARMKRKKNSHEVMSRCNKLKPIGFQLLRWYLEECKTAEDLMARIRRTELALSRLWDSWESPKRPEEWGAVYEGLKILEHGCVKVGLAWRVPSVEEFFRDVVYKVESSTWSIKRNAAERFAAWFDIFLVEHTFKSEHGDSVRGMGELFFMDTIRADGAEVEGYWVTESILDLYNSRADESDRIPSLKELSLQSADLLGIPHALVLDNDGEHSRNVRFGDRIKRAAFVSDVSPRQSTFVNSASSEKDGNSVTKTEPDARGEPCNVTTDAATPSPSNQASECDGNSLPDAQKNEDVTVLPGDRSFRDDDSHAEGGAP